MPNAVFDKLAHHKNLGIHTEMFSDGVIDLVEKGAITNAFKTIQTGKIVSSFALGTKRLYDFSDDNSFVGKYKLEQWGQHSFASCSSMVLAFLCSLFINGVSISLLPVHPWCQHFFAPSSSTSEKETDFSFIFPSSHIHNSVCPKIVCMVEFYFFGLAKIIHIFEPHRWCNG